jgi:hypothetical protein
MSHIANVIVIFIYENSELLIPKVLQTFAASQAVRSFFSNAAFALFSLRNCLKIPLGGTP